ncbi:hypothetical protein KJ840_05675 [Patescibacteria group bacterium]|nr:hypothetical protein [Patescibacteria group bacterium]
MHDLNRFILLKRGGFTNVIVGLSSLPTKPFERTVVCIREKDKTYKILSINCSKKDGSINIFFPYCKDKNAYIKEHKHKYKAGIFYVKPYQIKKEFIVDKTTKLSIHKSGFVQLSGDGILSGINKITGKPKGIGIFSSPLHNPVKSGPTFVFNCWGVNESFELLTKRIKGHQYIILDKEKGDFTGRFFDQKETILNSYLLEFFIFPEEANKYIYEYNQKPFINHRIVNYIHDPGAIFSHPVLDLKYFNGVLCVFPALIHSSFAKNSKYGYILGSPGGYSKKNKKFGKFNVFHVICPRTLIQKDMNNLQTLEYNSD